MSWRIALVPFSTMAAECHTCMKRDRRWVRRGLDSAADWTRDEAEHDECEIEHTFRVLHQHSRQPRSAAICARRLLHLPAAHCRRRRRHRALHAQEYCTNTGVVRIDSRFRALLSGVDETAWHACRDACHASGLRRCARGIVSAKPSSQFHTGPRRLVSMHGGSLRPPHTGPGRDAAAPAPSSPASAARNMSPAR